MVKIIYAFWFIPISFVSRNSLAQDHSYLNSPVAQEIVAYDAAIKKQFLEIINRDGQLPDTEEVCYHFLNGYMTTLKDNQVLTKEDFENGNFLYKIELETFRGNGGNLLVNSFYVTPKKDTVFLVYSYPKAVLLGPKRKSKKIQMAFSVARETKSTFLSNKRLVDFVSFCHKKNVKVILYTSARGADVMLSHAFCIAEDIIYVVKNMNTATALPLKEFVKQHWESFAR